MLACLPAGLLAFLLAHLHISLVCQRLWLSHQLCATGVDTTFHGGRRALRACATETSKRREIAIRPACRGFFHAAPVSEGKPTEAGSVHGATVGCGCTLHSGVSLCAHSGHAIMETSAPIYWSSPPSLVQSVCTVLFSTSVVSFFPPHVAHFRWPDVLCQRRL